MSKVQLVFNYGIYVNNVQEGDMFYAEFFDD